MTIKFFFEWNDNTLSWLFRFLSDESRDLQFNAHTNEDCWSIDSCTMSWHRHQRIRCSMKKKVSEWIEVKSNRSKRKVRMSCLNVIRGSSSLHSFFSRPTRTSTANARTVPSVSKRGDEGNNSRDEEDEVDGRKLKGEGDIERDIDWRHWLKGSRFRSIDGFAFEPFLWTSFLPQLSRLSSYLTSYPFSQTFSSFLSEFELEGVERILSEEKKR